MSAEERREKNLLAMSTNFITVLILWNFCSFGSHSSHSFPMVWFLKTYPGFSVDTVEALVYHSIFTQKWKSRDYFLILLERKISCPKSIVNNRIFASTLLMVSFSIIQFFFSNISHRYFAILLKDILRKRKNLRRFLTEGERYSGVMQVVNEVAKK